MKSARKKVLIFIVAYHAESTLASVLNRVVLARQNYDIEILIIDDASQDRTFDVGLALRQRCPYKITVLRNPLNQGYGGNQKIGYHYAIQRGFDIVVLLHGDGQYAPERLADLISPLARDEADAVLGSRMIENGAARRGGMPLYKFAGNKILTYLQNHLLKTGLSEFHSGYRAYTVKALTSIPFEFNTKDFHFDSEIIIQLIAGGFRIKEVPIPTYYGDEICHVNGIRYAANVVRATLLYVLHKAGIFYQYNFDLPGAPPHYDSKLGYPSSHTMAVSTVGERCRVLDIGYTRESLVASALKQKGCTVYGINATAQKPGEGVDFYRLDVERNALPAHTVNANWVLLLDVIEHLSDPELCLMNLRRQLINERVKVIITTPNIGFWITRFMHLIGQFNYGKVGILDKTHTRLFTFSSLRRTVTQCGFVVERIAAIPAPYPKALGAGRVSRALLFLNSLAIKIWRRMFAYQIFMQVHPLPTLETLLRRAIQHSCQEEQVRTAHGDTRP